MVIATTVGISTPRAVHFQLPVSFLIVSIVVPQGQCNKLNSMVLRAVR